MFDSPTGTHTYIHSGAYIQVPVHRQPMLSSSTRTIEYSYCTRLELADDDDDDADADDAK